MIIMQPKEDMCGQCSDLQSKIVRAKTEVSRQQSVDKLKKHTEAANEARDHYRESIKTAKEAVAKGEAEGSAVLQFEHITFDFTQQATVPHHAREVGALYFKVPLRIQIFRVAMEAVPAQHNYLFDEYQAIGKDGPRAHGPNAGISMLHHHLDHHSKGAPSLCLQADNCCWQNKNHSVLGYLCWRILVGLNTSIEVCFMRIGHTRCFVDGGFGLIKQKYRKSDVDTLQQFADVVDQSAQINHAVKFSWDWSQWDAFLAEYFTPVKNITKCQRFVFSFSEPGKVSMSGSSNLADKTISLVKSATNPNLFHRDSLPMTLPPAGKTRTRADYLFKQIRQHCHEENRDTTCPDPDAADEV